MIYISQLIFIKEDQEEAFLEFEAHAIPLMEKYKGRMIYRLRPEEESFVSGEEEKPFEIHFISFESEEGLAAYLEDDERLEFIHLKEASIRSTMLIKGAKM